MYDYRRGGGVLGAFLLGGAIGAVLGLLFAPRPGKETREMLADSAQKYWGDGKEFYETGVAKVGDLYSSGRDMATERAEELRGKIDAARDRLKDQVDKTSTAAKEKVVEVVPAAKDAVSKAGAATRSGVETAEKKAQEALDFVAEKAKSEDVTDAIPEA